MSDDLFDGPDNFSEDLPGDGVPRDPRWGKPGIYPKPGRGKTHQDVVAAYKAKNKQPPWYRRATKFIDVLENKYNIDQWAKRCVAKGMAERPDLQLAAASLTMDKNNVDFKQDRAELDKIAEACLKQARADAAATEGTALHKLTQRIDRGETIGYVPERVEKDLDAYVKTRDAANIKYGLIETLRVFDPWKVAGTPDRTGLVNNRWCILDVKTGSVDWDDEERLFAMQFALYSRSVPYTHEGGRFEDAYPLRRDRAIVIHLPVGQGKCDLYEIDITRGWDGCERAQKVWDWRQQKGLMVPFVAGEPPARTNDLDWRADSATVIDKASVCPTLEDLRELWQHASEVVTLGDAERKAFQTRAAELEAGK